MTVSILSKDLCGALLGPGSVLGFGHTGMNSATRGGPY